MNTRGGGLTGSSTTTSQIRRRSLYSDTLVCGRRPTAVLETRVLKNTACFKKASRNVIAVSFQTNIEYDRRTISAPETTVGFTLNAGGTKVQVNVNDRTP